ncbi:MAG: hypothetical protein R3258_00555 [Acidimicrobiia bacterium]|nr:hypothetical protein [Acidimicrobiia bacterium]
MAPVFIPIRGNNLRRRLTQLSVGLILFGFGIGLMLESGLGVPPWDVLHQGLAVQFGTTVGIMSIFVSVAVLLLWLPLRERFGVGTVLNAIIIGIVIDVSVAILPAGEGLVAWLMVAGGMLIIGLATGMYIGANLGPGPRDGLMTAIARRGPSIRVTRWGIEIIVLLVGWLMGGTFGIGTVAFALGMGPIVHITLPRWTIDTGRVEDSWAHPAR